VTSTDMQVELLPIFREEANDRLDDIVACLLDVEAGRASDDATDHLFRHAHSIKGSAGMVGMTEAQEIAHSLEDILSAARDQGSLAVEQVEPLLRAADELRRAITPAPTPASAVEDNPTSTVQAATVVQTAPSLRIAADKVDRVLGVVGETVLHHRRLEHLLSEPAAGVAHEPIEQEVDHGEQLLSELQDAVLGMRTLPISSITTGYPRAVRDAAKSAGIEVELVISGAETQLDRALLDGLSEPIGHLLRNAVAHGIESPEDRERAGKPRRGRIDLHAEPRGGLVCVEVRDDGRGVGRAAVAEAATHGSLMDVLAAPGYTTARQVSGLAGRGVGLDALKSHVEGIGGSLEVSTETGRGTCVTVLLPVTLALMRVLVVERGGQRFGLPLLSVLEAIPLGRPMTLGGRPSIQIRDERMWLADLARLIGAPAPELATSARALVVGPAASPVAIACDAVLAEQEVVVKSLGFALDRIPGYLGAAILGDGGILLILDPAFLIRAAASPSAAADATVASATASGPPRILVVDDQFTVRELERSILSAAGFAVETACDGREALETLAERGSFDLVVTDLLMPGMGGLELLRTIRADPTRSDLPVIVVTSQASAEDRALGARAGADAYIVKDEFDQRALLATVGELIGRR
jgi:two-component system, chemotaxis family, sensor kinase CheA